MDRYSELCGRAAEFVRKFAPAGPVLVLAPARIAAEEVALAACSESLVGVHARAFRDLVTELAAAGTAASCFPWGASCARCWPPV